MRTLQFHPFTFPEFFGMIYNSKQEKRCHKVKDLSRLPDVDDMIFSDDQTTPSQR